MTDTPKFTVVDRRKLREADEPAQPETPSNVTTMPVPEAAKPAPPAEPEPKSSPRLTLVETPTRSPEFEDAEELDDSTGDFEDPSGNFEEMDLPGAPTAEEIRFQATAYQAAAERIDDLVRAQNPAAPPMEKVGFEHLIQQLYLSALMQMGAGTPEGQRPRVDIVGARQTIDLIAVLADKTTGNLSKDEDRALQAVLFELRMTFLEITRAVTTPTSPLPPPPGAKR
jgi:hypothetical protein